MAVYNNFSSVVYSNETGLLITTAEAKEFLKVDFSDEDALIERLVKQASSRIKKKHSRDLIQAAYTDESYNGEGHEMIFIKNWPVQSIDSIKIDDQEIGADDFTVAKDSGIVKYNRGFPEGMGNIKVSYTGGFPAGHPELDNYKLECVLLVADLYEGRGA